MSMSPHLVLGMWRWGKKNPYSFPTLDFLEQVRVISQHNIDNGCLPFRTFLSEVTFRFFTFCQGRGARLHLWYYPSQAGV